MLPLSARCRVRVLRARSLAGENVALNAQQAPSAYPSLLQTTRLIEQAIVRAEPLDEATREVEREVLDELMQSGYGIFSGREVTWATLRFAPERARWVSAEVWHPQQRGAFDKAGRWVLELPYNDPRELMMDVLKHGASVEVIAPDALRARVRAELDAAIGTYAAEPAAAR